MILISVVVEGCSKDSLKKVFDVWLNQHNHNPKIQFVKREVTSRLLDRVKENGIRVSEDLYILPGENGYSDMVIEGNLHLDCFITGIEFCCIEDGKMHCSIDISRRRD